MALQRKAIPSPSYSSRGGATARLVVLHTAEGARTFEELGAFFANPASGVSSHVGIDDKPGVIGEYVQRGYKAWTAANANPVAVQAELCAFAAWTPDEWDRHPDMLDNTARWIAEEAAAFGLPITRLTAQQAQGSGRGVCQHDDLDEWGGNHWDCGPGFPMDAVLERARVYATGEGDEMGYPTWFWDWANWYLTTDRDPGSRPPGVPATIPNWAWDGVEQIDPIGRRYGMTTSERDWLEWYLDTNRDQDDRPSSAPTTIPDRWWDDERWLADREQR
jgi:hypothetical protein